MTYSRALNGHSACCTCPTQSGAAITDASDDAAEQASGCCCGSACRVSGRRRTWRSSTAPIRRGTSCRPTTSSSSSPLTASTRSRASTPRTQVFAYLSVGRGRIRPALREGHSAGRRRAARTSRGAATSSTRRIRSGRGFSSSASSRRCGTRVIAAFSSIRSIPSSSSRRPTRSARARRRASPASIRALRTQYPRGEAHLQPRLRGPARAPSRGLRRRGRVDLPRLGPEEQRVTSRCREADRKWLMAHLSACATNTSCRSSRSNTRRRASASSRARRRARSRSSVSCRGSRTPSSTSSASATSK